MPIIEPPDPQLPLSQGDVLKDVRLFLTKETWSDTGGDCERLTHKLCMVLSRPCAVGHKTTAIVAAVEQYSDRVPKDVQTFEDILNFLADLRDALDAPDVFYLGQLPGLVGRYCAKLDSLHTIHLPSDKDELLQLTSRKRIARLNIDFVRDLHLRIFRAFASLGFDDHRWMSTEDLRWLVAKGREEVTAAESALRKHEAALNSGHAQGFRSANEKSQLEKQVREAQQALQLLRETLAPYEAELATRPH